MIKVLLTTVRHEDQRYDTVGDYVGDFTKSDGAVVTVSDMGDWRAEILVAVHEVIEFALCVNRGISNEEIDQFDKTYEANRSENDETEPGDSPAAPYYKEHRFATSIEMQFCAQLGLSWDEYDKKVRSL